MGLFSAGLIGFALVALIWASARARDLCVLSVRRGRVLVMRGALPASLFAALTDIVARRRVARSTIRVMRDGDSARLSATGLDEATVQRLRNVLGTYPLSRLLAMPEPLLKRNLGQRLGLAWLGWWLNQRQ